MSKAHYFTTLALCLLQKQAHATSHFYTVHKEFEIAF